MHLSVSNPTEPPTTSNYIQDIASPFLWWVSPHATLPVPLWESSFLLAWGWAPSIQHTDASNSLLGSSIHLPPLLRGLKVSLGSATPTSPDPAGAVTLSSAESQHQLSFSTPDPVHSVNTYSLPLTPPGLIVLCISKGQVHTSTSGKEYIKMCIFAVFEFSRPIRATASKIVIMKVKHYEYTRSLLYSY